MQFDRLHLEDGCVTLDTLVKLAQINALERGTRIWFDQVIFTPTLRDGEIVLTVEISDRLRDTNTPEVMYIDIE